MAYCIDCNKQLKKKSSKRCKSCNNKYYGQFRALNKSMPFCVDCGKELKKLISKRCKSCNNKNQWKLGILKGSWNKGMTFEYKPRPSMKGKPAWNKGLTKDDPRVQAFVNKKIGVKRNEEQRKRISDGHKGQVSWCVGFTQETHPQLARPEFRGEKHWNWKGGVSDENINARRRFARSFKKQILKRDNYTCQMCGSTERLQVDHIQKWSEYVELRFNVDNCRTLCSSCHYKITYNRPIPNPNMIWGGCAKTIRN